LAIDTATRTSTVALGRPTVVAMSQRATGSGPGSALFEQIDEVLGMAGAGIGDLTAMAVGTGPGSFTGLRVGLAAAKTLAWLHSLPLCGVPTTEALRRAAMEGAGAPYDVAVVLPAGAHDHYLARHGRTAVLVGPGHLTSALEGDRTLTVDLGGGPLGEEAARWGESAVSGLGAAVLALAAERSSAGSWDDPVELVPTYVALPRGAPITAEELGWSPDLP
jgi:tRNA threonylcarbamoyl adenosine modification protein YeaZ